MTTCYCMIPNRTVSFPSNMISPSDECDHKQSATAGFGSELLCDQVRFELDHLIRELIDTEKDYLNDLQLCHDTYFLPLSKSCDVSQIFTNWTQLIDAHKSIMKRLPNFINGFTIDYARTIETFEIFMIEVEGLYVNFCSQQKDSTRRLESMMVSDIRFRQLINECHRSLVREIINEPTEKTQRSSGYSNLSLTSFLLKPMQRITKYDLLFDRICKTIEKSVLNELLSIAHKAKLAAQTLCTQANEACRQKEDSEDNKLKLKWAQTHIIQNLKNNRSSDIFSLLKDAKMADDELIHFDSKTKHLGDRVFLKSGSFTKYKSGKELVLFLFNDMLIITRPQPGVQLKVADVFSSSKARSSYYVIYKRPILLEDLSISQISTNQMMRASWSEHQLLNLSFSDEATYLSYNLMALGANEKSNWYQELTKRVAEAVEAKTKHQIMLSSKMLKQPTIDQCYGRLHITILKLMAPSDATSAPELRKFMDASLVSRLCFSLQLKHSFKTDLMDSTELVLQSEPFISTPIRFGWDRSHLNCVSMHESFNSQNILTAKLEDECSEFLLKNDSSCDSATLLEMGIIDNSRYRQNQIMFKRRINLNQLIGLDNDSHQSITSEMSPGDRFRKILPEKPIELVFKMKSTDVRHDVSHKARQSISPDSISELHKPGDIIYLSVRLKFHLQLF